MDRKVDGIFCAAALLAVIVVLLWISLPVVGWGLSHADDALLAHGAKSIAVGKGYGWARSNDHFSLFDPALSTGPTLILPIAFLIWLFGTIDQLPGGATLAIFMGQLAITAFVLSRRFGWVPTWGFLATVLWLLMLASARNWYFGVFIGETVAYGFLLIGISSLAISKGNRGIAAAGFCFALAFMTKQICVFAVAGVICAWLVANVVDREERGLLLRRVTILVLVGASLPLAFEAVKLVILGLTGYQDLWRHTVEVSASQAIGNVNKAGRLTTFIKVLNQTYMPVSFLIGLAIASATLFALTRRSQPTGHEGVRRFAIFAGTSAAVYLVYILTVSLLWQRYFWIGVALLLTSISAPLLALGSRLRMAMIVVVVAGSMGLGLHRDMFLVRDFISKSKAPVERASVVKILDEHPKLPYAAQGWSSIFDVLYLRHEEGTWAYEPYLLNLRNQGFIALINDAYTLKNGPFFKAVVTQCEPLTPQGRLTAYRCDDRFWAQYPAPGVNRSLKATNSPANPALPYYGAIDRVDCAGVGGWVWKTTDPAADIKVEFYIDDQLVETQPARNVRPDLTDKVGTGRYGFSFTVPLVYKDAKPHAPAIKVAGTDFFVPFFEPVWPAIECEP